MLAKARYDAETFWYRGNGSVDVVVDTRFVATEDPERSVVVYGNADTNLAWQALLGESPIQVKRDRVQVGPLELPGESLLSLFIQPRPHSDRALVAAIGGSNLAGMRATTRLPVFVSGTGYPDALVASADLLESGSSAIKLAGYFGPDWGLADGQWAPVDPAE
jgi:hypothetical protein